MKEILLKLKEAYIESFSIGGKDECRGLCHTSYNRLSRTEDILFQEYLSKYMKTRKVFYNWEGKKTSDKHQFLWIPTNAKVRLEWLDKQIAKH